MLLQELLSKLIDLLLEIVNPNFIENLSRPVMLHVFFESKLGEIVIILFLDHASYFFGGSL